MSPDHEDGVVRPAAAPPSKAATALHTESAAAVARLSILLEEVRGKLATEAWASVSRFFAVQGSQLPPLIRNEFVEMQTGLYGEQSQGRPQPLEADEKLARLRTLVREARGSRQR